MLKKVLSLCLALLVCLSCCTLFAFADEGCSCGFTPVIYVGPLGCADIIRDKGTDNEQILWKADAGFILKNVKNELGGLLKGAALNNKDEFASALIAAVNESFMGLALDKNGNSQSNVTVPDLNFPTDGKHGRDYQFYFNYDFRLDPYTHADRLYTVIEKVKELTGHNKVQLKASSMGGVVLSAYLDRYGYEGIETIICQCCPLWGTAVAGEMFCGKVEFNKLSLKRYAQDALPYLDGGDFLKAFLYSLTDILSLTNVWGMITGAGTKLMNDIGDRVFDECLIPIFGTLPGIWAFVPAEYYEEALGFMKVDKTTELYSQISHYRTAQQNIAQNLNNAKASGVKTYIFCGYNVQRTPLVSAWKNTSDGTVDTKYASLGATCAEYGKTLSKAENEKYFSKDKMIDASTCALPDCTWFNKDWLHCNGQKAINEFYEWLLTSKEQVTVFDNAKYPQFLQNDDINETLTPVTGSKTAKEIFKDSPSLLNFIKMLSEFFSKLLRF